jgi:DNA-binding beta-propeller fold protein YncE
MPVGRRARSIAIGVVAGAVSALGPGGQAAATEGQTPVGDVRRVVFVGNNWEGTADVVQPRRFKRLARLNIIPDFEERMREIESNPERLGYFLAIRQEVGEGHDQFVDDMFSSHNGRVLYVSRPSLADVIAMNLRTRKIIWRTKVDGNRADHMAISPDGRHVLVSASTAKVVDVIDTKTGRIVARIPSGDQPHENNFSKDGRLVYHASIGTVFTPLDDPIFDASKGERVFEVIDASNWQVLKKIDMGKELDEFGEPDMSGAVRPMALTPDERYVYFQVSFFHGFVEYDLQQERVLRLAHLPVSDEAKAKSRQDYLLDSAHHGLAMNPAGQKLCVAGTMSDYAAIVDRSSFAHTIAAHGHKPYWATNSGRGSYCFVSFSGDDAVSVISYRKAREIARIQVGDHPQRMRMGKVRAGLLGTKKPRRRR